MDLSEFKNIQQWSLFVKKMIPFAGFVIRKRFFTLLFSFILSAALYYYAFNYRPYNWSITYIFVPKNNNVNIDPVKLKNCANLIAAYAHAANIFQSDIRSEIKYNVKNNDFVTEIIASYKKPVDYSKVLKDTRSFENSVLNIIPSDVKFLTIGKKLWLPEIEWSIQLWVPAMVPIFMLLFLMVFYSFDDTIYDIKNLEDSGVVLIGYTSLTSRITPTPSFDLYWEQIRNIYGKLKYVVKEGNRVILITSTTRGEGKTSTACALAKIAANFGQKVLLIDADMRRPAVAGRFDIAGFKGLSNLLISDLPASDVIIKSNINDNLYILPSGPIPPIPIELLSESRMTELIKDFKYQYDYIFIDSPPSLLLADAKVLAAHCSSTILVTALGYSRLGETLRVWQDYYKHQIAQNCCMIVNKVTKSDISFANYGYGYGYDYDDGDSMDNSIRVIKKKIKRLVRDLIYFFRR